MNSSTPFDVLKPDDLATTVRVYLDWLDEHKRTPGPTSARELLKYEDRMRELSGWNASRT